MPVYLIRCSNTEMVKIGWADENVDARRQALQSAHWEDLIFIRVIDCESWVEYSLHRRFADQRVRREWFRFHPDMLTVSVAELKRPETFDNPVSRLIESVGGPTRLSETIRVPLNTVCNWKTRGSIPAKHHFAVIRASDGKITAAMIIDAHNIGSAA